MLNGTGRLILNQILDGKVCSSKQLADFCSVSANTIRKEIQILNKDLNQHGINIVSFVAKGFQLEITDPVRAKEYMNSLIREVRRFNYIDLSSTGRIYFLIRTLLVKKSEYVTIDYLSNLMHYSKTTIVNDFPRMENYLKKYNLKLVSKRNRGTAIEGEEWNKRLCLIAQYKYFGRLSMEEKELENEYQKELLVGDSIRSELLSIVVDILRKFTEYNMNPIDIRKLVHLIIINLTRKDRSNSISFNDFLVHHMQSTLEYRIAREIYDALPEPYGSNGTDLEYLMLAAFLASYRNLTGKQDLLPQLSDTYYRLNQSAQEICNYITERFPDCPKNKEEFINSMTMNLVSQEYRTLFNISLDDEVATIVKKRSPYILDICRTISDWFFIEKNTLLSTANTLANYELIFNQVHTNYESAYPIKVLISSLYGSPYEKVLTYHISSRFKEMVESVNTLSNCDFSKTYDLFLCDFDPMQYKIGQIPAYKAKAQMNPGDWNVEERLREYIYREFQKKLQSFFSSRSIIKTNYQSKEECLDSVSKLLSGNKGPSSILETLYHNDMLLSAERIKRLGFLEANISDDTFLKIFINKRPFLWNEHSIRILCVYNYGKSTENTLVLRTFLQRLINRSEEYINNFMNDADYDRLCNTIFEYVRHGF